MRGPLYAAPLAPVRVCLEQSQSLTPGCTPLATIYKWSPMGGFTPITQPGFQADQNGNYEWYADPTASYREEVTAGGTTHITPNITLASSSGTVNGSPIYVDVANYGAYGDGQVGIGTVSAGTLNQVTLTTGTFNPTADVGKTLAIANYPVTPPPLPVAFAASGAACTGTGTLGNASYDLEYHYILSEKNSWGEGQPSLEGVVLLQAINGTSQCIQIASPAGINGASTWNLYDSIDPPFNPTTPETTWPGVTSGLEALERSSIAIGTAVEIDSISTGGANAPQPTMTIATITSATSSTATLSSSLPNPVAGNTVSWGHPDDAAFAAAQAALDPLRGGTIFVPQSTGNGANVGCYFLLTGISTSLPYFGLVGSGPASGYGVALALLNSEFPYAPAGTSELCTPADIPILSVTSPITPRQLWAGFRVNGIAMSDVSGVGNGQGCIYALDINQFTIEDSSCAYMSRRPAGNGSYKAGTNTGGYGFNCNSASQNSFCQFGTFSNFIGQYVNTGIEWTSGRSSEDKFFGNKFIGSSTGGGAIFFFNCNGGITGGGVDHFYGNTANYTPVFLYACDRRGDVVFSRAENSYSPTSNIGGHSTTGTGVVLIGTGAVGVSDQVGILTNGCTESGTTATCEINTATPPSWLVTGLTISVNNVAVTGYDGNWVVTTVIPGGACGGGCATVSFPVLKSGLGTSGPGTLQATNTCQANEISGTLVNFHDAVVIGTACDGTNMYTLNAGGDSPRNELFNEGTDTEICTNLGCSLQSTQANIPALQASPGAEAANAQFGCGTAVIGANGMCAPIFAIFGDVARTQQQLAVDQFGNTEAASVVSPLFQNGSLVNDPTSGTAANALVSLTSAGAAIVAPHSSLNSIGVCTQTCGTSGSPVVAGANSNVSLLFDGAVTSKHYAGVSASQDGAGTDIGSSPSSANGTPVIQALATGSLGNKPTLGTITEISGTSSLLTGTYYVSAVCLNPVGGETLMQTADFALSVTADNSYDIQEQPPTCNPQDVAWLAAAGHRNAGSGTETIQPAGSPYCHPVSVYVTGTGYVTACTLTSSWAAGSVATGPALPSSDTDGPLVPVWIVTP
ncbi:MAG TPA: hypothetical protein VGZ29_05785 [Terriglobia bacterium]|nr:hypothetical protein [Terriglobia bacterium]